MNNDNCDKMEGPLRPMTYKEMESEVERLKELLNRVAKGKLKGTGELVELADSSVSERLAEYAHEAWSGWMKYMFKKCSFPSDGTVIIPKELADRWHMQMTTPYMDLPDEMKDSDRQEARRMIAIFCKKQG